MAQEIKIAQGHRVTTAEAHFADVIKAAVDYRGDVTLELKDGNQLEGYLFNFSNNRLSVYPKDTQEKKTVLLQDVVAINFTGKDYALGKSWDDYQARKKRLQERKSQ